MNKRQSVISSLNNINANIYIGNNVKTKESILIAVSGGQDSICLFFIFVQLKKQWHWSFGIIYCNHLWQKNSFFSGSLILKIAYLFVVSVYYVTTTDKIFSEQDSRKWRYTVFFRISSFYNYTIISSGHTESDKTETVLFQFIRGGSLKSLIPLKTSKNFSSNNKFLRTPHIKNTYIYFKRNLLFFRKESRFLIHRSHHNKKVLFFSLYVAKQRKKKQIINKPTYYFAKSKFFSLKKNQEISRVVFRHRRLNLFFFFSVASAKKNQVPGSVTLECEGQKILDFFQAQSWQVVKKKESEDSEKIKDFFLEQSMQFLQTRKNQIALRRFTPKTVFLYKFFISKKTYNFNLAFHKNYLQILNVNTFNQTSKKCASQITKKSPSKFKYNNKLLRLNTLAASVNPFAFQGKRKIHFLVRPLTIFDRFKVKQLVQYFILPIYPDISNKKKRYYRNRIRSELIPTLRFFFNPQIQSSFFQFSDILVNEQFYLNLLCKQLIREFYVFREKKFTLNITLFKNLPVTIQNKLIQILLKDCTNTQTNFNNISKITKLVKKPRPFDKIYTIRSHRKKLSSLEPGLLQNNFSFLFPIQKIWIQRILWFYSVEFRPSIKSRSIDTRCFYNTNSLIRKNQNQLLFFTDKLKNIFLENRFAPCFARQRETTKFIQLNTVKFTNLKNRKAFFCLSPVIQKSCEPNLPFVFQGKEKIFFGLFTPSQKPSRFFFPFLKFYALCKTQVDTDELKNNFFFKKAQEPYLFHGLSIMFKIKQEKQKSEKRYLLFQYNISVKKKNKFLFK